MRTWMVHKDSLIESLGWAARLWMVCCCCQVFTTKEGTHRSGAFVGKLSTIVSMDVRLDAVRDEAAIEEDIFKVCDC